jgi:DNA-3-methyladenine glycosylase II
VVAPSSPEDATRAGTGRTSPAAIAEARRWLAVRDPVLAAADAVAPPFVWRLRPGGYSGLVKMIVEQQVSIASAAAIWRRVETGLGEVTPAAVLARDVDALRGFGLSAPKARYALGLAEAVQQGQIDFEQLDRLDDRDAVASLTALKGVGRWTAETYLMFCHGRMDVFPAGDVALQEAHRVAAGLADRCSEKALYTMAETWRPYRGVAAHLLWAYYSALKREKAKPLDSVIPPS